MERDLGGGDLDVGGVRTNQHSVAGAYGRCSGYGHLYENPSSPCHGRIVDELILRRETKHPDIVGRDELTKAQTAESDIFENTQPRGVVLVVSPTHTAPVGLPSAQVAQAASAAAPHAAARSTSIGDARSEM
jgi:hypothetical protein